MKRDRWRMRRILLQYEQTSSFKTQDSCDAYHVALLLDEGYVVGVVRPQNDIPQEAEIYRLTSKGHSALQKDLEFFSAAIENQTANQGDESQGAEDRQFLRDLKLENGKFRDTTLSAISIGGIGLAFSVVSFLVSKGAMRFSTIPLCALCVSVLSWAVILVVLLFSAQNAVKAIESYQSSADSDAVKSDRLTQRMNWINIFLMCVGILAFGIFLCTIGTGTP